MKLTRFEVAEPANVAIYPWDLTPPVTQTTNPVSDDIVSSASPSEGIVVHGKEQIWFASLNEKLIGFKLQSQPI